MKPHEIMKRAHDREYERWWREWASDGMKGEIWRKGEDGRAVLVTTLKNADLRITEECLSEMASDAAWRAALLALVNFIVTAE